MVTGMRRAELCALRWREIHLVASALRLEHSVGARAKLLGEGHQQSCGTTRRLS
jgi:integrase